MDIITVCPFCGVAHVITVRPDDYLAWRYDGISAQDAFPYLDREKREMIISGICPDCWDEMFGDEDDEDALDF